MPVRPPLRLACLLGAALLLLTGTARAQKSGITLQIVPVDGPPPTGEALQLEPGQRARLELRAQDGSGRALDLSATPVVWQSTNTGLLQVKGDGPRAIAAAGAAGAAGEVALTATALKQTVTLRARVGSATLVPSQPVTVPLATATLDAPLRAERLLRAPPANPGTSSPPAPTSSAHITMFSPKDGRQGDRLVISGSGFSSPPGVMFADGKNVGYSEVVDGPGALVNVYVPPGDVTGHIMVSGAYSADEFVELASFDPAGAMSVPPDGEVIVTGKAMQNVIGVTLGSQPMPIVSKSYNRLTFKLSPVLQQAQSSIHFGQASLTYRVGGGGDRPILAGPDLTVQVTPVILALEPDSGSACDVAAVRGRALINDPSPGGGTTTATVTMGPGATSPYAFGSNSLISFSVPKGAISGPVTVKGYNQQLVSPMPFRIIAPKPTAYMQGTGTVRVGEHARFIGRLLEVTKVSFTGGVELTQGWDAMPIGNGGNCQDLLDVVVPPGAQSGLVTFTNPAGTVTSSITVSQ